MRVVNLIIIVLSLAMIGLFAIPSSNTPHWIDVLSGAFWGVVLGYNLAHEMRGR